MRRAMDFLESKLDDVLEQDKVVHVPLDIHPDDIAPSSPQSQDSWEARDKGPAVQSDGIRVTAKDVLAKYLILARQFRASCRSELETELKELVKKEYPEAEQDAQLRKLVYARIASSTGHELRFFKELQ